jgi:AmmeMemoRadiSam system protein B
MTDGLWETPLGKVEIDSELATLILQNSDLLEEDYLAHSHEHSIEVQLPFLQYLNSSVKITPVLLARAGGDDCKAIGKSIAKAIHLLGRSALIVASSDMTHYESRESAHTKDMKAIDAILKLDEDELLNQVEKHRISMCGYGPVASLVSAARDLGAVRGELVQYQTSGDVTGNYDDVVGYAGVVIQ